MKYYVTIILLIFTLNFAYTQSKEVYSKVKIHYESPSRLQALRKEAIALDHGIYDKGDILITEISQSDLNKIKKIGYQVEIMVNDVSKNFKIKNKKALVELKQNYNSNCSTQNTYPQPTNFNLGSMGGYFTYQEVLDILDEMKTKFPALITVKQPIGNFKTNGTPDNSTTPPIGGNDIFWVKISDNPDVDENEPEILYDALHHAREPLGLSQLIYYMWYLLENYQNDEEIKTIIDHTELYFVPVVNPDGYLYNEKIEPEGGGFWRKNRYNTHGVDLNRNYDHYPDGTPSSSIWASTGTSSNPNNDVYPGTEAFSEVETQAMRWFAAQHEFVVALNNHTFGNLLLYPYGYASNQPTPDNTIYQRISEFMVSKNGYDNKISSELYPAAGDSDDYMYGGTTSPHQTIFAFTPEIGSSFWPLASDIIPISQSMMFLNLTAAKLANSYAEIKDNTPLFTGNDLMLDIPFTIERLGLTGNGAFSVSVEALSENIEETSNASSFTNIAVGEKEQGLLNLTLKTDIETGEPIEYNIVVTSDQIESKFKQVRYYGASSELISDNASNLDNYLNNGWATTSTTFVSSSTSITDSPNANYSINQNKSITFEEEIDLTDIDKAFVKFYAKWELEKDYDFVQFQISADDGNSWSSLCGNYTSLGSNQASQPTNEPLYDGIQSEWVQEQIDLEDYLGTQIKLRFILVTDENTNLDGFYFDDLEVITSSDPTLSIKDESVKAFTIFPNPVRHHISIKSTTTATYTIQIKNVLGQEMTYIRNARDPYEIDLSDYTKGLYFITINDGTQESVFKILKL